MTAIGVIDGMWTADVADDGSVVIDGRRVQFAVAAEDRWHLLSEEPSLRQRSVRGTPVVETRVRVPEGDVVFVTYGVADGPGAVAMEITNESPLAVAIACSDPSVVSARPPASVAVEGVALPAESVLFPLGHKTTIRLVLPVQVDAAGSTIVAASVPPSDRVANGWRVQVDTGARYTLPGLDEAIVAARCQLLLRGIEGNSVDGERSDVLAALCTVAEMARMGRDPFLPGVDWAPDLAALCIESAKRHGSDPLTRPALEGAATLFDARGETRAARDIFRLAARLVPASTAAMAEPDRDVAPARWLTWLAAGLVSDGSDGVALFTRWPNDWLGQNVEIRDVPTRHGTVSAAIRWHGPRPALLWECSAPMTLTCPGLDPGWKDERPSGEALLAAPTPT
ncbi:MAG: hypothetical protein AB7V43_15795 [Acidimicrobiia bacterium]